MLGSAPLLRPSQARPPVLLALAALLAACSCPSTKILIDDFERCTGTCGWAVSGGAARVVSTILPGEHGLRIDGGATAVKAFPIATIDTSYSLQLVADCPAGLAVTLAASVPGAADIAIPVMVTLDTTLTSSGDPPDYTGASYVPLSGLVTLPTGVMAVAVHQITLAPSAGATCTVDIVRITSTPPCSN